jgi:putative PIN family toxin of toxin-antitoxin system
VKIILDANVIIAAFAAHGLCSSVLELCLDRFDVVLSEEILKEVSVHLVDKIKLPAALCESIITFLKKNCFISPIDNAVNSSCRDKNDFHVLGLAQHSSADYIVTGEGKKGTGKKGTVLFLSFKV